MVTTHSNHPFHLKDYSPWPLTGATGAMIFVSELVKWFILFNVNLIVIGMIIMLLTMIQSWQDVIREGTYQGLHTSFVSIGLWSGTILFIASEMLFFMSLFWAFFSSSLSPTIELGMMWPPTGIQTFNSMQIPLLNTAILLASGVTVTWAHYSLMKSKHTHKQHKDCFLQCY